MAARKKMGTKATTASVKFNVAEWQDYLRIDPTSLDSEIERHPYLFYQVADAYVNALSERDLAQDKLKQCDAELNFSVRDSLSNEGYRVTEEMVKSAVLSHPEHIEATERYLEAKRVADEIEALKSAFQQRGYMLRDLAQLYITGYMADTATGSPASASGQRAVEQANRDRLRAGLSTRRREQS